jgi:outer membrane protein OmpA-like peptidoglycan-associated protein
MAYNPNWKSDGMNPGHASGNHPFAFSYGLECRYRLGNRIQLVADISGMTTARDFDGVSPSSGFGDHMISLSAGLSISLGRVGYRRVVDAIPYMVQNDQLLLYAERLVERNSRLVAQHVEDERIKTEYRKILDIEGLLDDYREPFAENKKESEADTEPSSYPRNNYSGLNSLRARLDNRDWDGKAETMSKTSKKRGGMGGMIGDEDHRESSGYDHLNASSTVEGYLAAMKDGMEPVGAPVFFFFRKGSDELTEVPQLLNIDVLARIARTHRLRVGITGAADSATGNERINSSLSRRRAETVRTLLVQRGVDESLITTSYEGGINDYSPVQANRHTCVTLSF